MARTVIAGGGAIGLALAWELARRNHAVTLVERDAIGKGTSWAGAGILPAANFRAALHPFEKLRGLSHELHAQWAEQLRSETGIDNGFRRCGGLYLARTPGEAASLAGWRRTLGEESIACETLSPHDLIALEPALTHAVHAGQIRSALHVPGESQVRNPHYLQALRAACEKGGVEIREQTEVVSFTRSQRGLQQLETTGGSIAGDQFVITTGAWTSLLLAPLVDHLAILPIRGQILLFKCEQPPFRRIINEGSRYLVPRDDGHVLVGATEEETGFENITTEEALIELRQFAFALVPELARSELVRQWSGLRPASFDGLPYLGRLPDWPNVFVAAGHFRSGLHLSPGTAVVMADLLENLEPAVDLKLFRVGR